MAGSQAQLPVGPPTNALRSIPENFAFHTSPESFIASRIQQATEADPSLLSNRIPIRAKVLNRNVAVVSSYKQIQAVLDHADTESDVPPYEARSAYNELMRNFFPPPNLLLADGCPHRDMKKSWEDGFGAISSFRDVLNAVVLDVLSTKTSSNIEVDLYAISKEISWRILLKLFLDLEPGDKLYNSVQSLQEELLRGQFSLLPVSINFGFWQSPRSRGIEARRKLQDLIEQRIQQSENNSGILHHISNIDLQARRDHTLMMTSSLACKGLASLLTAFLLNLFLFERGGVKLSQELESLPVAERSHRLRTVYLETERLSPPIVGVMRKVKQDMILKGGADGQDTLLPVGWDVWLYFVGGGRDPEVFGDSYMSFQPDRYIHESVAEPLGFGLGAKSCLGKDLMRRIVLNTADVLLDQGICFEGQLSSPGLRGWLGWDDATPEQWAADMKQLPTQHPRKPIMVTIVKQDSS